VYACPTTVAVPRATELVIAVVVLAGSTVWDFVAELVL
jgi:hypothetical protein